MTRTTFAVVATLILATACGGGETTGTIPPPAPPPPPPPPAPPAPPGTQTISLTADLRFVPASVTISPGTNVRWVYEGGPAHTVTPRNRNQPGVWEERDMSTQGQVFDHEFTVAGETYDYFCVPHEADGMTARIIVEDE